MPTLRLRFPGRRYHATPWGHHVNEGQIEWPPSPWRLLRALLATGYAKLHWPASGPPLLARTLIEKLAAAAPCYRLPAASGAHSRHYMPMARFKNGREETTLVFDTWAQVEEGALEIRWSVLLAEDELTLLAQLAHELPYLGRSESWVEAELVDDSAPDAVFDVRPGEYQHRPGLEWEQVALIAPISAGEYTEWLQPQLAAAIARTGIALDKKKHSAAEQKKLAAATQPFPADLIACLQVQTSWLQELGWNQPPGSRKLLYWRPRSAFEAGAPVPDHHATRAEPVSCMLLSIATASGNLHALPPIERTLPQAELLHKGLVHHATRDGGCSPVLSGCDEQGRPLQLPHQHAHLLHLDLDGDGHLDHALVWAPMGLDALAQEAVRATRRSYTKGGTAALRLALAGAGSISDLGQLPQPYGQVLLALVGGAGGARRWRSLTPFVPPRHLKRSGRNTLAGQVTSELLGRGQPEPLALRVLDPHADDQARRGRHFKRSRRKGAPQPPQDCGFMLELEFEQPIAGPIAIGYASHFGLGLFSAIDER